MILIRNLVLISVCCRLLPAQTVSTSQFNIQRTAATTNETTLTQSNVSNLHLQGSFAVDGAVYAQPLIIDGVNIGGATRVLIVATVWDGNATADGGSLYAFDADKPGTSPIWHVNLVTPPTTGDGCLATPVVDTGNAIVYAVCQDAAYRMWLYALNLADGSTYQAANQITCTYSGVTMMDHVEGVRTGLLLYGGQIYFGASAVLTGDEVTDGSRGWVFEYNAATLAQTNCMTVVPHLVSGIGGAGIWQAGVGFAVDSGGSIRFGTGNGVWNGPVGDYGESIMKLSANLSVLDYFTPADWATLNSGDTDQDAGGIMVAGSHLFQWGKSGILWVDPAGGLNGSGGSAAQSWDTGLSNGRYTSTVIGSMAFGNNVLYLSGSGPNAVGPIKAYTWNGSTFNTTPAAISANTYSRPGARLSYSSNGSIASTELLWAITAAGPVISYTVPGTLRVFNASTLSELWNSDSSSGNAMGFASKFVQPTIADGKIYAATSSKAVVVYGLLATPTVTFTGAPASAPYNSTFTVSSSTNASTTAVITASGACSISGNTVTMTSGTGTCTLTATWAADSNYTSTTATQSTTASKIAPTVTFTGAPASAPDNSIFTVSSSTNASTTAVITASGACSISGNRVTMTSGTGTCTLTATWAADSNYTSATATQSTTASGSSSAPWPNGYSYQATFTVAAGQVPSAQTNFPALISGTFTDFATTANGGRISNTCTQTVGNNLTSVPCDLIFTSDAAGTMLLNWEFETWTPATGAVNLWVNVPNLSNGTVIYAWYGQPSVTTPQTTPSATWSSNFMAVYHLKENPAGAAPQMNDSTANANHATMNGAVQASQQQPGEIDGSVNFEGNTWASIANPANFSFERTDSFSLSGWFKLASNAVGTLFSKFPAVPSAGWLLLQQPSASDPTLGLWLFGSSQSSWAWGETPPVTMGAWHYVVATYSGTSTVAGMRIYVDGVNQLLAIRGNTLTSSMVNTLAPAINGRAGPNQMSTASMDELRVSTKGVVFSPAWVTASYNNQSKPGTFFTVVTGLTNRRSRQKGCAGG